MNFRLGRIQKSKSTLDLLLGSTSRMRRASLRRQRLIPQLCMCDPAEAMWPSRQMQLRQLFTVISNILRKSKQMVKLCSGKDFTHLYPNQQVKVFIIPKDASMPNLHTGKEIIFHRLWLRLIAAMSDENGAKSEELPNFRKNIELDNRKFNMFYENFMNTLSQTYCLKDLNVNWNESMECRMSPSDSVERVRSSQQNGSDKDSSQRVERKSHSKPRQSASEPMVHNKNNKNYFGNIEKADKRSNINEDKKVL